MSAPKIVAVTPYKVDVNGKTFESAPWGADPVGKITAAWESYQAGATMMELERRYRVGKTTLRRIFRRLGALRGRGGQQASHRELYAQRAREAGRIE